MNQVVAFERVPIKAPVGKPAVAKTSQLQTVLNELWTQQDLITKFGVTGMTIHLWRQNRGLPTLVIPGSARPAVRFIPGDVKQWAKQNNVPLAA